LKITFQIHIKPMNFISSSPFEYEEDKRNVQRQAFAGMLWNKQFYYYVVEDWLKGDRNAIRCRANRVQQSGLDSHE